MSRFPTNHSFAAWDRVRKSQTYGYWQRLRSARSEYIELTGDNPGSFDFIKDNGGFYTWMQNKYGIKVRFSSTGEITGDFDIVNEQKFTFFLLRFTL
jgi:hypothetical protein